MFPQFTPPYNEDRGKHHSRPDNLQRPRRFQEEQRLEQECADNVGGAVDQGDGVRLLELVRADGEGLLEEGSDHEQEDLVALQATGGEAGVSHGKEEGDVHSNCDHPAGGGQCSPVHVVQVAEDDGDDGAKGSDGYKGEGSVHHRRGVFNLKINDLELLIAHLDILFQYLSYDVDTNKRKVLESIQYATSEEKRIKIKRWLLKRY